MINPSEIENVDGIKAIYDGYMKMANNVRTTLKDMLIHVGVNEKRANECANFVLPRATESTLTIGFTPEALLQFMHKRLCNRAQPEIKKLAIMMKQAVREINPEFAEELVPHCVHLLWCPEGNKMTCGAFPTKDKVKEILEGNK